MARRLILIVALVVGLAAPASAGFDEGKAAYDRGDYVTALREWRPLAEQGDAKAQYNLGGMYANGQGVPQDYAEAVRWYRKAAEQGHDEAQYTLGFMYAYGWSVAQDYAEAARWYRQAAEQGYANAQHSLGVMYREGQGVPQDYAEAVKWYRKAAEQGLAEAQTNLGDMYGDGKGVLQDYVQAYMWFNLAASVGFKMVFKKPGIVAQHMTPEQIAKAQRLAREWKPKVPPKPDVYLQLVQSFLKGRGYDPGPVDGLMGERTRSAIASFKADMASAGTLSDEDRSLLEWIEGLPK